ncbi:MAG: class I SAM-dependent methyltransferase [Magnetococcales bacterium]|nr:class I SAM-dependent methyltransferase [Magnetococcales bacterium]
MSNPSDPVFDASPVPPTGRTDPKLWDAVWENPDNLEEWTYLSHIICETVAVTLRNQGVGPGLRIAEAGCGSGRITLKLGDMFHAIIHFLDFSSVSVNNLKNRVARREIPGHVIQGDLFAIPIRDGSLDVIWNAGVLEHFTGDIQRDALKEMIRVLKPGGLLITLNPFAGSLLHTLGKAFVEKLTRYPYGEEIPIDTLENQVRILGFSLMEKEYSIGFIALFVGMYKRLMILPGLSFFRFIYRVVDGTLCWMCRFSGVAKVLRRLDLLLSRLFGGYILVSVVRKDTPFSQ